MSQYNAKAYMLTRGRKRRKIQTMSIKFLRSIEGRTIL
jgi:hypothetical protein